MSKTVANICGWILVVGLLAPGSIGRAAEDDEASVIVERRRLRLDLSMEFELLGGFRRTTFAGIGAPLGAYLLVETHTPRRNAGAMAYVGLGMDPLQGSREISLRGIEVYHNDAWRFLDLRVGRLNLVRGGRFRFVDGADVRIRFAKHLHLACWGGAAWHPELAALFSGGPVVGADLAFRPASAVGGGLRYEHQTALDGGGVDRIGADVSLHLPRAAGLVAEARLDAVPAEEILELVALAAELRPHHRWHVRLEGGATNPVVDVLGRGGRLYDTLADGPTLYVDGRVRVGLPPGMLTLDAGVLGVGDGDGAWAPGVRSALGFSSHPGRPWRHSLRVGALHGSGGTAGLLLGEVGRRFGPLDLGILAEQALYQYRGRPWRATTHGGVQVGLDLHRALHLSLTGELELGRNPAPEGLVMLVATIRVHHGKVRTPFPVRDRYLSPWSPYRWRREHLPRSPGTVPGADPYPSVPQGSEATGES